MTDIYENAPIYVCEGCGTKFDNLYNYCDRYAPYEACPSCMTNEELYELEFGTKNERIYSRRNIRTHRFNSLLIVRLYL